MLRACGKLVPTLLQWRMPMALAGTMASTSGQMFMPHQLAPFPPTLLPTCSRGFSSGSAGSVLPRITEPHSKAYLGSHERVEPLVQTLRQHLGHIRLGGGHKAVQRHHSRGKQ